MSGSPPKTLLLIPTTTPLLGLIPIMPVAFSVHGRERDKTLFVEGYLEGVV